MAPAVTAELQAMRQQVGAVPRVCAAPFPGAGVQLCREACDTHS